MSLYSPSWLGDAVSRVLERLDGLRAEAQLALSTDGPDRAVWLDRVAALYEREAVCWRVLASSWHTADWPAAQAMIAAASRAREFAEDFREFAARRRRYEAGRREWEVLPGTDAAVAGGDR